MTLLLKTLSNFPSIVYYCSSVGLMFGIVLLKGSLKHYMLGGGGGNVIGKRFVCIVRRGKV